LIENARFLHVQPLGCQRVAGVGLGAVAILGPALQVVFVILKQLVMAARVRRKT
jgi:hypothetical protein